MNRLLISMLLLTASSLSQALILDFESYSGSSSPTVEYGGLTWSKTPWLYWPSSPLTTFQKYEGAVDDSFGLVGGAIEVKSLTNESFNFHSIDYLSWGSSVDTIKFVAYSNGAEVYSSPDLFGGIYIDPITDSHLKRPATFIPDWLNIDTLRIYGSSADLFGIDNFNYSRTVSVAEPSILILFLTGFMSLFVARKPKRSVLIL